MTDVLFTSLSSQYYQFLGLGFLVVLQTSALLYRSARYCFGIAQFSHEPRLHPNRHAKFCVIMALLLVMVGGVGLYHYHSVAVTTVHRVDRVNHPITQDSDIIDTTDP